MLQVAVQVTPYVTMHPTSFLYTHRAAAAGSALAKAHLALPMRVLAPIPSLSQSIFYKPQHPNPIAVFCCWLMRLLEPKLAHQSATCATTGLHDPQNALPYLSRFFASIHRLPDARFPVVVRDRASLIMVRTQPLRERRLVVIRTLNERLAGDVVGHVGSWRVEDLVV